MERYSNSRCSVLNTVVLCYAHLLHDQVSEKVALNFGYAHKYLYDIDKES